MSKFNIGDKVAYSVQFLDSIGESPTGDLCHCRGTITKLDSYGTLTLATIDWQDPEIPERVNVFNLAKVGLNHQFCKC